MVLNDCTKGMVSVELKDETFRDARACAKILISKDVLAKIADNSTKKGNVLEQSKIAGVIAAKKTSDLIPLCHPLRITNVEICFEIVDDGVEVESYVSAVDRTGVEMEALTAAATACLNIYDMCKMYDHGMTIENVYLLEKKGGRSGHFRRER